MAEKNSSSSSATLPNFSSHYTQRYLPIQYRYIQRKPIHADYDKIFFKYLNKLTLTLQSRKIFSHRYLSQLGSIFST